MADEWIKMRPSLLTSPKVNAIARLIEATSDIGKLMASMRNVTRDSNVTRNATDDVTRNVTRNAMESITVTSLLKLWGVANDHTSDGVFNNADLSYIDDIVGVVGFGLALESVGWAEFDSDAMTVTLPNFNEYNTSGRKRKGVSSSSNAERQRAYREKKRLIEQEKLAQNGVTDDVTRNDLSNVTHNVTRNAREEKNREDIKEYPLTPLPGGESSLIEKPKRERKQRTSLKTFVNACSQAGEKPISGYGPLQKYVQNSGLPLDFVQLAWEVFKAEFLPGGSNESRLQSDWRKHFLNYVSKGYYRLWYAKATGSDGSVEYHLSTTGLQAQAVHTSQGEAA